MLLNLENLVAFVYTDLLGLLGKNTLRRQILEGQVEAILFSIVTCKSLAVIFTLSYWGGSFYFCIISGHVYPYFWISHLLTVKVFMKTVNIFIGLFYSFC